MAFGDLFGRAIALAKRRWVFLLAIWVAMVAYNTAFSAIQFNFPSSFVAVTIAIMLFKYMCMFACLYALVRAQQGHAYASVGRCIAFFVLIILATLGETVGYIFLILPGLYLAARWSIAAPTLLAEEFVSVLEAFAASWRNTQSHVPAITLSIIVSIVPILAAMLINAFMTESGTYPLYGSAVPYGLMGLGALMLWIFSVAAYDLLNEDQDPLEEIFA